MADDRHGVQRFHPLTTLSIGAVRVVDSDARRAEDVASNAARAKREAKAREAGLYLLSEAVPGRPGQPVQPGQPGQPGQPAQ